MKNFINLKLQNKNSVAELKSLRAEISKLNEDKEFNFQSKNITISKEKVI